MLTKDAFKKMQWKPLNSEILQQAQLFRVSFMCPHSTSVKTCKTAFTWSSSNKKQTRNIYILLTTSKGKAHTVGIHVS